MKITYELPPCDFPKLRLMAGNILVKLPYESRENTEWQTDGGIWVSTNYSHTAGDLHRTTTGEDEKHLAEMQNRLIKHRDRGTQWTKEFKNLFEEYRNLKAHIAANKDKKGEFVSGRYQAMYGEVIMQNGVEGVRKGATLYFPYLTVENIVGGYGFSFIHDGAPYIVMEAKSAIMAYYKEDDYYLCLNGNCLLKKIEADSPKSLLQLAYEDKYEQHIGEIVGAPKDSGLHRGMRVYLPKDWDVPLESEELQSLPERLYYLQADEVLAAVDYATMALPTPKPHDSREGANRRKVR